MPSENNDLRHLVSIDDLTLSDIRELFTLARTYSADLRRWADTCRGLISASLFYEPSTRTRLSFESAMLRLGGGVISSAEMATSSASKGESLADTVRVVSGSYADCIILRHTSEGAARLASRYSAVPVINGGDGSHEHLTQTLCDLYTLWIEKGEIEGLDVVLAGDLRYSRTIHSFIYALARFGANIACVPHHGLELPDYVVKRLREEYGAEPVRADLSDMGDLARESDAVYLTPQKPHQLSLFTDAKGVLKVDRVDAVYMTRPQTERYAEGEGDLGDYVKLGASTMAAESLRDAVVMHPLPRRDEISLEFDSDPRGIYFKQASRGVPLRMAILATLLGRVERRSKERAPERRLHLVPGGQNPCPNTNCISHTETRHVPPAFHLTSRSPVLAVCGYCQQELPIALVGCSTTRHYHPRDSAVARKIRPEHLVFFRDGEEALAMGYSAAAR
jgi:aspartate carbamoyltransferase catalytic subunit